MLDEGGRPDIPQSPHQTEVAEVVAALNTDLETGLSSASAAERLQQYGRNELQTAKTTPAWKRFLAQFTDVLVIMLLIAAAISASVWLIERDSPLPYEALAIFAVVIVNAMLGYYQVSKAESAVAALRKVAVAHAIVIGDGKRIDLPAEEVVPGDIMVIEEGSTAPADGRIARSTALQMGEAALTGESLPVSKDTKVITGEVPLGDRK